ncbi:MAG: hypothetical protein AAGA09_02195 [Pseudomonadota bacterium]
MRKPFVFGAVFGAASILSINVQTHAERPPTSAAADARWVVLAQDEKIIVDRIAADFYESTLRPAQSEAIEDATASSYVAGDGEARNAFLRNRRRQWREMSDDERDAFRNTKSPSYANLTETQKAPFRRHALDLLQARGAINEGALAAALRSEI